MNRWLTPLLISLLALAAGFEPSNAEDRAALDRCEAQLTVCYVTCKAEKPAGLCNVQCSTALCGFPWRESFGGFQDRLIEITAAYRPGMRKLTGLMLKEERHVSSR